MLRGLTFALPAAAYVLGGRWSDGPEGPFGVTRAVAAWAMAALCGWGWNQGLAHRAHLLLLAQRPGAAARTLLRGAVAGAGLSTVAAAAVARPGLPSAIVFAAYQALYVASATVLLVLGRERALLYVLAPLTVAACCGSRRSALRGGGRRPDRHGGRGSGDRAVRDPGRGTHAATPGSPPGCGSCGAATPRAVRAPSVRRWRTAWAGWPSACWW